MDERLARRHNARKVVTQVDIGSGKGYARAAAAFIASRHQRGTRTLAIVNTVERAQAIYKALRRISAEAETVLIHSRFRGRDREEKRKLLSQEIDESGPGRVVVATQAIEAGVDISARTLITETGPVVVDGAAVRALQPRRRRRARRNLLGGRGGAQDRTRRPISPTSWNLLAHSCNLWKVNLPGHQTLKNWAMSCRTLTTSR